ncbi:hypothetical protein PFISCL1PPCAC_17847, partial [Pristionchus fissidentatus]
KLVFDRPEEEIAAEEKRKGNDCYWKPLSWLKVGDFMKIGQRACQVTEITTGKGGKHGKLGYNKCIAGHDVFTGEKRETSLYECYNVEIPFVESKVYLLINVTFENICTLLDEETGDQKDNMRLPEGPLGQEIRESFNSEDLVITVTTAYREAAITKFRRKEGNA